MLAMRRSFFILIFAAFVAAAPAAYAAQTQARLLLGDSAARPGTTVLAGIELQMPPKMHTYWRNPGESGQASEVTWKLPPGVTAGALEWPVPDVFDAAGLVTYGYHDTIVLVTALGLAADLPAGPLEVQAKVSWLECEEMCVPGDATVKATLTVGGETKPSAAAAALAKARERLPAPGDTAAATAVWADAGTAKARTLLLTWRAATNATGADFLPYPADAFEVAPAGPWSASNGTARLPLKITRSETNWPTQISGVLVEKLTGQTQPLAREIQVAIGFPASIRDSGMGISPVSSETHGRDARATTAEQASGSEQSSLPYLLKMLALAFVGGLVLNIMPCVFPVIALKILGFVQQSREAPERVFRLGLVYALGVVASFLVLAGMVIAVRQAGGAASWGMQMQNPQFTLALTTLVVLVALNLFGVFEVTLGSNALGAASKLAGKEGAGGAFFNGVLATALATPCTAPALASALGFAFTQPAAVVVLFFLCVALGLAAPYVLLSWRPAWLKLLPRPGAWMERFKQAMGFPMLATAVWLYWFTTDPYGPRGVLWIGFFLVAIALAAWVWGQFVQRGTRHRAVAGVVSVLIALAGYGWALEKELRWRTPEPPPATGVAEQSPGGIAWERWSPEAVAAARAAGRPVLVDFTAKWCTTCQWNKVHALEVPAVMAKLKALNAVTLIGDFTRQDAAIAEELRRHQRAGVPLVLVYPADAAKAPIVLPALLTQGVVLEALEGSN